eukprot:Skav226809  [mRNA]  locus=scaffold2056:164857:165102:- [translate_table: standard]
MVQKEPPQAAVSSKELTSCSNWSANASGMGAKDPGATNLIKRKPVSAVHFASKAPHGSSSHGFQALPDDIDALVNFTSGNA